jgi:hypothetical protein
VIAGNALGLTSNLRGRRTSVHGGHVEIIRTRGSDDGALLHPLSAVRHRPAFPIDVENNSVGIFELPLEVIVVRIAQIKEELAAGVLDLPLLVRQVINLEAEMMHPNE